MLTTVLRRVLAPLVPLLLLASPLLVTTTASAAPATTSGHVTATAQPTVLARHACTRTSKGTCIRGGQFCPRAKYHKSGWDAKGRRYVCKGNRSHPHWMKP